MRAARSSDDYSRDPIGAYHVEGPGLVFCAGKRGPWGFALWGRPTATELRRIVRLLALELQPSTQPHASLVDLHRLEAGDPRAFAVVTKYLRDNFDRFRTQVTKLALIRPPGLLGATVAGFFEVAGAPYPVRVFGDVDAAAAWVGGESLVALLSRDDDTALLQLRRWLDAHLEDESLRAAAKALGRASRSLQRDLANANTTYEHEADLARMRMAKQLLVETASSLTEIAYDVGCASPQHFSALFKRLEGVTPSAFRRKRGIREIGLATKGRSRRKG